jgi:hypothetical protein
VGNRSCRGSDSLLRHGTDTERGKDPGDVIWDPSGDEGRDSKWRGKKERMYASMVVKLRRERGNGEGKKTWRIQEEMERIQPVPSHNLDPGHVRTFGPAGHTRATSIGLGSSEFVRHLVE